MKTFAMDVHEIVRRWGSGRGAAPAVLCVAMLGVLLMAVGCAGGAKNGRTQEPMIQRQVVAYQAGAVKARGTLAWDSARKGKRPGVLVCHEWWGNNEYTTRRAEQLAREGYVALALDMYGEGNITTVSDQARAWSGELYANLPEMRTRMAAAMATLSAHPHVDPTRLAAIGYCFGGAASLELARSGAAGENLRAVVCFHTSALAAQNPDDNAKIKARVLVCTGGADQLVPAEVIAQFESQMRAAGVHHEVKSYPEAKHSFTNPEADSWGFEVAGYNQAADEASWRDMLACFEKSFVNR